MKLSRNRALAFAVISSIVLLTVTGCSKSNSGGTSSGMSATVSGSAWATNFPTVGVFSTLASEFEIGGLQFKGGDSTAFALVFLSPVTVNSTISSGTGMLDIGYVDTKTQQEYDGGTTAGHSILTVTSYDSTGHKIAGTFSGVLYNITGGSDSLIVTNGKFSTAFTAE